MMRIYPLILFVLTYYLVSCGPRKPANVDVSTLGANEEITEHLKRFQGRGALTDDSAPLSPEEALKSFTVAEDLKMDLVLAEPRIFQPVELKFDRKGRLWVVQYNQYPYPKGLRITGIDNHLRLQFDRVPPPPPEDLKGADRITFFEDTNGDGIFDKATESISGLNITTSVLHGKKKIWVLSPPYLLAYDDRDGNGIPEGNPEVHLSGFGLEDTHAVANSLRWGPDGWIYGAQGSTTTANISSRATRNVRFSGQAIWRYHPETYIFEIYAEGGGNTFNVEIDSKGKVFSGTNGYGRGPYYKQGGYYRKSWGKHGPLTNPYAFGYLEDMSLEGENIRFTHALIRYEGGSLPQRYHNHFIAPNPLQGNVVFTEVQPHGSSLKNKDVEIIVDTKDRWFRPIDIKTGPDGNVYFTDWYDSRLSHVDARDTWHKTSGRIYRLSATGSRPAKGVDFTRLSEEQLVECFYSPNKWVRFTALQELDDRDARSVVPRLRQELRSDTSSIALESLWALNLLEQLDDQLTGIALSHRNESVREWAVRLIGDRKNASPEIALALEKLARTETSLSVRSQLAASARRLPPALGINLVKNLVLHHDDHSDPDLPLMLWWALEAHAETGRREMVRLFTDPDFVNRPVTQHTLLERIVRRYAMAGGEENDTACRQITMQKASETLQLTMLTGLEEGLKGKSQQDFSEPIRESLEYLRAVRGEPEYAAGLRNKNADALQQVLKSIGDSRVPMVDRLTYVRMLGDNDFPESVGPLLKLLASGAAGALKTAALASLMRYNQPEIGETVVKLYPDNLRGDPEVRTASLALLTSRASWSRSLINAVQGIKTLHPTDLSTELVNRMKILRDDDLLTQIYTIWPQSRETSHSERSLQMTAIQKVLREGKGNARNGREVFTNLCGSCHRLFGEGSDIGPELTGYDRRDTDYFILNTVDPNADIREGYTTYTLTAKTGQSIVGRLTEQSAETVKIKPMGGEELTFSMKDVTKLEPLTVSLMPERLLDGLSDQEIRDLFAYIQEGLN